MQADGVTRLEAEIGELKQLLVCLAEVVALQTTSSEGAHIHASHAASQALPRDIAFAQQQAAPARRPSSQWRDSMLSGWPVHLAAGPLAEAAEGLENGPGVAHQQQQQQQQQAAPNSSRPRPHVRLELPSDEQQDNSSSFNATRRDRTSSMPGALPGHSSLQAATSLLSQNSSSLTRQSVGGVADCIGIEAPPMSPRLAMAMGGWAVGRASLKPTIADIVLRLKAAKESQITRSNSLVGSAGLPPDGISQQQLQHGQLTQPHGRLSSMSVSPHSAYAHAHAEVHVSVNSNTSGTGNGKGEGHQGLQAGVQQHKDSKQQTSASFSNSRPGSVNSQQSLDGRRGGSRALSPSHGLNKLNDRSQSPAFSDATTKPRARIISRRGLGWDCLNNTLVVIKAIAWDVLLPTDPVRMNWDLLMLLLLAYVCIALPYAIAFDVNFSDMTEPIAVVDLIVTALFIVDMWINVHTAYISDYTGKPVRSRWKIVRRYAIGWFWVDAVSCIPFDFLFHSQLGLLMLIKISRVIRLVKVLRLLKLLHLTDLLQRFERLLGRAVLQMLTFMASALTLIHWAACAFYFVAHFPGEGNTENWLYHNDLEDAANIKKYIASLYWSVTTIMTIGYGDIVAYSIAERIVAIIVMLVGGSTFGYFLGAMSTLVAALNTQQARMTARRQAVDDFLKHRKVPHQLSEKVRSFYGYVVEREVQSDEAEIIAGLSSSLRTQVVLHLYQEALEKVPFFRGKDPQFITSLVTYLKLEYYAPGDVVVRQGDVGAEMYFIGEGHLEVRVYQDSNGSPLSRLNYRATAATDTTDAKGGSGGKGGSGVAKGTKGNLRGVTKKRKLGSSGMSFVDEAREARFTAVGQLKAGEYFGEYSCLLGEARGATVVASTYTELYSLSRGDLEEVLQQWPELAEEFEAMVHDIKVDECGSPVPLNYSSFGPAQPQDLLRDDRAADLHLVQQQQQQQQQQLQRPSVPLQRPSVSLQKTSVSLQKSSVPLQRSSVPGDVGSSGTGGGIAAAGGGKWAAMRAALQDGHRPERSEDSSTQQQKQQQQKQHEASAGASQACTVQPSKHPWDEMSSSEAQQQNAAKHSVTVIHNSLYSALDNTSTTPCQQPTASATHASALWHAGMAKANAVNAIANTATKASPRQSSASLGGTSSPRASLGN